MCSLRCWHTATLRRDPLSDEEEETADVDLDTDVNESSLDGTQETFLKVACLFAVVSSVACGSSTGACWTDPRCGTVGAPVEASQTGHRLHRSSGLRFGPVAASPFRSSN